MRTAQEVAPGVGWLRTLMVNIAFVEPEPRDGSWVLVDAGLRGWRSRIARAARRRYQGRPPAAIVLTHAHFDHVGSLEALVREWDVPVYAHPLELPHLTGRRSYPPPDPTVGGGAMAWTSRLLPRAPIDVSTWVRPLPADGSIPPLPGWRWVHTPGHTDGHVSLWRAHDRVLVSGDAIVTVKQESMLAVLLQLEAMHGPPAYFTTDWASAERSVRLLASMQPATLVPGHGRPLHGVHASRGLQRLTRDFNREVPAHGRYVRTPARLEGARYALPPDPLPAAVRRLVLGLAAAATVAAVVTRRKRHSL